MTRPLFTHVYGTLCCITATCSGNVVLRHKLNTLKLAHDASATDVANGLMNLPNSKHESAVFTAGSPVTAVMSGAATLCSTAGTTTAITFSGETGALPSIDVQSNQLASTATTPTIYFETVQTLTCVMTGAASGSFALELDGVTTDDIAFDASAATIQTQLTTMYVQELRERIPAQAAPTHCARVPSRERRCEPLKRSYSRFKTRSGSVLGSSLRSSLPRTLPTHARFARRYGKVNAAAAITAVVTFGAGAAPCADASTVVTTMKLRTASGNLPSLGVIGSLIDATVNAPTALTLSFAARGSKDSKVCSGIGTCNSENGKCDCGYYYSFADQYGGACSAPVINTSSWTGVETCPGVVYQSDLSLPVPKPSSLPRLYFTQASNISNTGLHYYLTGGETDAVPSPMLNMTNASVGALALDLAEGKFAQSSRQRVADEERSAPSAFCSHPPPLCSGMYVAHTHVCTQASCTTSTAATSASSARLCTTTRRRTSAARPSSTARTRTRTPARRSTTSRRSLPCRRRRRTGSRWT